MENEKQHLLGEFLYHDGQECVCNKIILALLCNFDFLIYKMTLFLLSKSET